MTELKFSGSKNALKYTVYRFEAGAEGKRAKINRKAAMIDFSLYPAKTCFFIELTQEETAQLVTFRHSMETSLEAIRIKEFFSRFPGGLPPEVLQKLSEEDSLPLQAWIRSIQNLSAAIKTSKREPDRILFIVEGETERNYIIAYARKFGVIQKITVDIPANRTPAEQVKEAARKLAIDELYGTTYREAWCVFDHDTHDTYNAAFELASRNPKIHLCWSNPCIEGWFLMHYRTLPCGLIPSKRSLGPSRSQVVQISDNMEKVITEQVYYKLYDPRECLQALTVCWPGYKKNGLAYETELTASLLKAVEQYRKSEKDPNKIGSNLPELLHALAALGSTSLESTTERMHIPSIEESEYLALEEKNGVAELKVEQARRLYQQAKAKRAQANNAKALVNENNQANFLKNAENKLNQLLELKRDMNIKRVAPLDPQADSQENLPHTGTSIITSSTKEPPKTA